jgi:solute carrier family 35 (UDP-sugar transporter), member A1/2/3
VSLPQAGRTLSNDAHLLFHDSTHFFPRGNHELGQMPNGAADVQRELTRRSATYEGITLDEDADADGFFPSSLLGPTSTYSIGLTAVLVAATVSGLNGVYFEKVLKDSPTPVSVWTRNIQMSFYSLFPALFVGVWWKDGSDIAVHGFFDGYNWVVWTAIVFHALTGIVTSLVINYADNIAKNFATSLSIVISFGFSLWFFDFSVTPTVSSSPRLPLPFLPREAPELS